VEGADALAGGWSAIHLDTKVASSRDNLVIIPIVLVVVFVILVLLLPARRRCSTARAGCAHRTDDGRWGHHLGRRSGGP
jgi:uncharacterized membrane protein YqiK